VYTKGEGEVRLAGVDTVRRTVNEGREGDTYLTYILDNYYDLPDFVVFTQAEPHDWPGFRRKLRAFSRVDVLDLSYVATYDLCPCTGCYMPKNDSVMLLLAPLYEMAVGATCSHGFFAFFNGQFIVSKRAIYVQSRRFYHHLHGLLHAPPGHPIHDDERLLAPHWTFSADSQNYVSF
jgi:Protein of unknown function (DUF3431)